MTLLRSQRDRKKGTKLVGGQVPLRISHYLTLFSIAEETSNARIIRELLEAWVKERRTYATDSELTDKIALRLNARWKVEKATNQMTFEQFKKGVQKELRDRDMPGVYSAVILQELKP
jgi:hypothetical protein